MPSKGSRRCPKCEKETDDFAGAASYCRACSAAYKLEKRYGISMAQYDTAFAFQGGACAICEKRPKRQRLAVDHNHKTGAVRGLLCSFCNHRLLGRGRENPALFRRAAEYLENPPFPRALTDSE